MHVEFWQVNLYFKKLFVGYMYKKVLWQCNVYTCIYDNISFFFKLKVIICFIILSWVCTCMNSMIFTSSQDFGSVVDCTVKWSKLCSESTCFVHSYVWTLPRSTLNTNYQLNTTKLHSKVKQKIEQVKMLRVRSLSCRNWQEE